MLKNVKEILQVSDLKILINFTTHANENIFIHFSECLRSTDDCHRNTYLECKKLIFVKRARINYVLKVKNRSGNRCTN